MPDPVNAETRGRLRLYKKKLKASYDAFDTFMEDNSAAHDRQLADFCTRRASAGGVRSTGSIHDSASTAPGCNSGASRAGSRSHCGCVYRKPYPS